jgi:hypothetical protein
MGTLKLISFHKGVTDMPILQTPRVTYQWRERVDFGEGEGEVLVVPWSDPMCYEFAMDFCWDTPAEAVRAIGPDDFDVDTEESDDWVLVRVTVEEVKRP